jgi:hypothetical protein
MAGGGGEERERSDADKHQRRRDEPAAGTAGNNVAVAHGGDRGGRPPQRDTEVGIALRVGLSHQCGCAQQAGRAHRGDQGDRLQPAQASATAQNRVERVYRSPPSHARSPPAEIADCSVVLAAAAHRGRPELGAPARARGSRRLRCTVAPGPDRSAAPATSAVRAVVGRPRSSQHGIGRKGRGRCNGQRVTSGGIHTSQPVRPGSVAVMRRPAQPPSKRGCCQEVGWPWPMPRPGRTTSST